MEGPAAEGPGEDELRGREDEAVERRPEHVQGEAERVLPGRHAGRPLSDPESSATIATTAVITTTALREDRLSLFLATARPKSAANAGDNTATSETVDVGSYAYAHAYMRLSAEGAEEVVELGVGQCGA